MDFPGNRRHCPCMGFTQILIAYATYSRLYCGFLPYNVNSFRSLHSPAAIDDRNSSTLSDKHGCTGVRISCLRDAKFFFPNLILFFPNNVHTENLNNKT